MTVLDLTVVNGVLEPIRGDLDASSTSVHWVIGAYAIGFGGFLLAGGRTADTVGPRRTFAAGSLSFALASLACAVAPTTGLLIAARGTQGLSAAFLEPAAVALVATLHPSGPERTRAFAIWASIGSLGAVSGMIVGGVAAELLDWRAVFLINVPVGLCGLALATRLLPAGTRNGDTPADHVGAALLTAGSAGLALLVGTAAGGASVGVVRRSSGRNSRVRRVRAAPDPRSRPTRAPRIPSPFGYRVTRRNRIGSGCRHARVTAPARRDAHEPDGVRAGRGGARDAGDAADAGRVGATDGCASSNG